MSKLFLLRHFKSQWNEDNRFAGWVDNPLAKDAFLQAKNIAEKLKNEGINAVYTSPLIRNTETVLRIFESMPDKYPLFLHLDGDKRQRWGNFTDISQNDLPVYVSENLNERYYGKLQGLNKKDIVEHYGEQKVHLWRRGWSENPPGGESLKDVYKRAVPFFKKYVIKDLISGKNVLLVASHNSLRAIVKFMENISDKEIENLELEFGELRHYELNRESNAFALK